jgi:hypothetical protein
MDDAPLHHFRAAGSAAFHAAARLVVLRDERTIR